MSHECEDCGDSFETLTRLRLHDCSQGESESGGDSSVADSQSGTTGNVDELDAALDRIAGGEHAACYEAIATFESTLQTALDADDGGETYRAVFWDYYEVLAAHLADATRAEGWEFLAAVTDAYDPTTDETLPLATPAIANAVGRHVVRTRLETDVAAIPEPALAYLGDVARNADRQDDVALEEVHALGWGIGHPTHPVADTLFQLADDGVFLVNACLEHAFYADQHAAVDLLERLVTGDPGAGTIDYPTGSISSARQLLDCVVGPDSDGYWPTTPRGWDWHEEYDYTFEWDPAVEDRIRTLVVETGVADELGDDWTFQDLAL